MSDAAPPLGARIHVHGSRVCNLAKIDRGHVDLESSIDEIDQVPNPIRRLVIIGHLAMLEPNLDILVPGQDPNRSRQPTDLTKLQQLHKGQLAQIPDERRLPIRIVQFFHPPQDGANPSRKNSPLSRLGHVVVHAGIKALSPLLLAFIP